MDASYFVDIKGEFEAKKLQLPKLNVLVPDTHFYNVLAIQPGDKIEVKADFIGHSDRATAVNMFSAFLRLAVKNGSDLVLSPEYSCPWEVLRDAIAQKALPQSGKIWALGCESITPTQLNQFIYEHPNVVWIKEEIETGAGRFLDVLAYLTKSTNAKGEQKDVIVLQFKTEPMGGDTFERNHLIRGRRIYIWHNPLDNIHLISLICSDALMFDDAAMQHCRFDLHPYMIYHPQLVQDPHHVDHRGYRHRLFGKGQNERFEVLSLNWARGFTFPGGSPNKYGGSAIYTKSPQFDNTDSRINANHHLGLFYTFWHARRTDLCFFSFDQHVFHYRMPKTFQDVLAVMVQRSGPEMLSLYRWDTPTKAWTNSTQSDDGFDTLCKTTFSGPPCDFCQGTPYTAVDRERLFTLSSGKLKPSIDWHKVREIESFIAWGDERSKRLTFPHEGSQSSRDFRKSYLERYFELQTSILTTPQYFPSTIQDLIGTWKLQPPSESDKFCYNLVDQAGQFAKATAIFIGSDSRAVALNLKNNLISAWGEEHTRRLVVWYKDQGTICHTASATPTYTQYHEPPGPFANELDS